MIIICRFIVPRSYDGITLFPFIFLRSEEMKRDAVLLNHEKIHLKQQLELFIVFFYLWYMLSFFWNLLKTRNIKQAYSLICFEQEAYRYEHDFNYIKGRPRYAFMKKI